MYQVLLWFVPTFLVSCGPGTFSLQEHPSNYADIVVKAQGASGNGFGNPKLAANGVRGGGDFRGGTDVFSLDHAVDGELVLAWTRGVVFDGPGADLVVFENAFFKNARKTHMYFEPVIVSVSTDGKTFTEFPHRYMGGERASRRMEDWIGFAGLKPVRYHEENYGPAQGVDPFDGQAGGDAFDLKTIGVSSFRYLKLTAARVRFPRLRSGDGDIDGAYARYFQNGKGIEP